MAVLSPLFALSCSLDTAADSAKTAATRAVGQTARSLELEDVSRRLKARASPIHTCRMKRQVHTRASRTHETHLSDGHAGGSA